MLIPGTHSNSSLAIAFSNVKLFPVEVFTDQGGNMIGFRKA